MIDLPWGKTVLRVPLPPRWRILGPFLPQELRSAAGPVANCLEALANPVHAAPLATRDLRGKRVLLIVDDWTRPTPVSQFFCPVRDALLQAGVEQRHIEILFALGVHRPMSAGEAAAKVGPENLAQHRWHNHDAYAARQLVDLGTTSRGTPVWLNRLLTEFDLLVPLGLVEPHLLLGFGGGAKMLLPGCAGALTIGHNHLQGVGGGHFNFVGVSPDDSPMRLDLEEGVRLLGREVFVVNAVLNHQGDIVRFFCGDAHQAFRAASAFVRSHAQVDLPGQADVVLTNSAPLDADLRQSLKCIGNALYAARPNGVVLGFLHCANGLGDLPLPPWTLPYSLLRPLLHVVSHRWIMPLVQALHGHAPIEERFLTHFGLQMLRRNHLWFFSENLGPNVGKKIGALRQFPSVEAMLAAAVRRVGPQATAAVFPLGGISYYPGTKEAHVGRTFLSAGA